MRISQNLKSEQQSDIQTETQGSQIKKEKEKKLKRMFKKFSADFPSYTNNNDLMFTQPYKKINYPFKATTLMEEIEIEQKKENFIKIYPSQIIRRQVSLPVPQFIKERDEQVKQVKQFRSKSKDNFEYDETILQQVWIPIIASFILIFIILLFTELFIIPKLR